jgi:hypothetical protein
MRLQGLRPKQELNNNPVNKNRRPSDPPERTLFKPDEGMDGASESKPTA